MISDGGHTHPLLGSVPTTAAHPLDTPGSCLLLHFSETQVKCKWQGLTVTLAVTTKINGLSAGTLLKLSQAWPSPKHSHSFP